MSKSQSKLPYIVGIGAGGRPNASTENALRLALRAAEIRGARTQLLGFDALQLPLFALEATDRSAKAARLVAELRIASGVIIASPAYHGGVSGLVKNALDYTEDMAKDDPPYFQGRAVGLIAAGAGWQGAAATLSSLRAITHALRGWPTPLGVAINTLEPAFDKQGACVSPKLAQQLDMLAQEVCDFGHRAAPAREASRTA